MYVKHIFDMKRLGRLLIFIIEMINQMLNDEHHKIDTDERKLKWDEENRLLASDDDGFVTNYWYDADGERTVKTSGESEQVYVNSGFAGGRTNTAGSNCISC